MDNPRQYEVAIMSAIVKSVAKGAKSVFPLKELLMESDGEPLESDWHVYEIGLLAMLVRQHLSGRDDFFAGGNMFLYYSEEQVRNKDFLGPDFFFVWGVSPMPLRKYWAVWEEGGRYPDVIIELLSPTTAETDRTTKKDIYEKEFRTCEYFCYDADEDKLQGWRLNPSDKYRTIKKNSKGWLWCEQLNLWLGTWKGTYSNRNTTWLRFYTAEGMLVPTSDEVAEQQRRRAEAAEAELARLKSQREQD
jgi:Uma2 family endonuclease